MEYRAQVESAEISGDATMTVERDSITVTTLFDSIDISYSTVQAIAFAHHQLRITTDHDVLVCNRMGEWGERFRDAVLAANHAALRRAHSVFGEPLVTARGVFTNPQLGRRDLAWFGVYPRCVMAFLDDGGAVRIPTGYLTGVYPSPAGILLEIGTGESYSLDKLGHESEPFTKAIEVEIRSQHAAALATVQAVAPGVPRTELSKVAHRLHDGVAADLADLQHASGGFVRELESLIATSRIAETYPVLRELAPPGAPFFVGLRQFEDPDDADAPAMIVPWLIAPLPGGAVCAVELPVPEGEAGATYGYRTLGEPKAFAQRLNRALESVSFRRGPFRLSDQQLHLPENADDLVAARRIPEVAAVRAAFVGRAIHATMASWRRQLLALTP